MTLPARFGCACAHSRRYRLTQWAASLLLVLCVGCGETSNDPLTGSQIGTSDVGTQDASSPGDVTASDDSGLNVGQNCQAPPENLGELASDEQLEISRSFHEQATQNEASCAAAPEGAGVYWFSFSVAEAAVADISLETSGASDAVIELRKAPCPDAEASLYCDTSSSHRSVLEPDETYFLLVQGAPGSASGQLRLTMALEPASCSPGERSCADGFIEACADGVATDTYTCDGSCGDGSSCEGDTCALASTVDVSTAGTPIAFSGDQWAYVHHWSAKDRAGCTLYEGETAGPTDGPEIFFRLTGHRVGDQILFDAEGGGTTFAFYILGGCNAATCLSAGAYDDQQENRFVWRATTEADVWVAAEVMGPPRDRPFRFEVSRLTPSP